MLRIAITGPESVGKSTLTKVLAEHFHGKFVTEFARDYVAALNRPYTYEDVEIIARKQMNQYDESFSETNSVYPAVFFDTFLMISKVWFNHVWHRQPDWFDQAIRTRPMDLYLLCAPDIPWEADNVRENGKIREVLFLQYKKELEFYKQKYVIIAGSGLQRIENAIHEINKLGIQTPTNLQTQRF